jgi:hypothetical protein
MSRWKWLDDRPHRLAEGTLGDLLADVSYCQQRQELSALASHVKTWRTRRKEAEAAIVERFGEEALPK